MEEAGWAFESLTSGEPELFRYRFFLFFFLNSVGYLAPRFAVPQVVQ